MSAFTMLSLYTTYYDTGYHVKSLADFDDINGLQKWKGFAQLHLNVHAAPAPLQSSPNEVI